MADPEGVFDEQPTRIARGVTGKVHVADHQVRYDLGYNSPWTPALMVWTVVAYSFLFAEAVFLLFNSNFLELSEISQWSSEEWFYFVAPIVSVATAHGGFWWLRRRGAYSTLTFFKPADSFKPDGDSDPDVEAAPDTDAAPDAQEGDGRYRLRRKGRRVAEGRFSPDGLSVEPYETTFGPAATPMTRYGLFYYPADGDFTADAVGGERGNGFMLFSDDESEAAMRQLLALCWQMGYRQEAVQVRRAPAEGLEAYHEQRRAAG